jgi:hypothetical protein
MNKPTWLCTPYSDIYIGFTRFARISSLFNYLARSVSHVALTNYSQDAHVVLFFFHFFFHSLK